MDSSLRNPLGMGLLLFITQIVTSFALAYILLSSISDGHHVKFSQDVQITVSAFWTFQTFIFISSSAYYLAVLSIPFVVFHLLQLRLRKENTMKTALNHYYFDWILYFLFRCIILSLVYNSLPRLNSLNALIEMKYLVTGEIIAFILTAAISTLRLKSIFRPLNSSIQSVTFSHFFIFNICFITGFVLIMNHNLIFG